LALYFVGLFRLGLEGIGEPAGFLLSRYELLEQFGGFLLLLIFIEL
jgi:hypothetical protein